MDMKELDLGWLAGLLEGEGSFMMIKNHVSGKIYLYPKVVVNMTDEDIIQRAAQLMGNSVYKMPKEKGERAHHKQQWRTQVSGSKAAELMVQLLPHMGSRRSAKIHEILEQYESRVPTETMRSQSCSIVASQRVRNNQGQFI